MNALDHMKAELKAFSWSLFRVSPQRMSRHLDDNSDLPTCQFHDCGRESAVCYVASHLTLNPEKLDELQVLIQEDLQREENGIHARSNEVMYLLLKGEEEEARQKLEKLSELVAENFQSLEMARAEVTVWTPTLLESEETWEMSLQTLTELTNSESSDVSGWSMYFLVMTLVKYYKKYGEERNQIWKFDLLNRILEALIKMRESSLPRRQVKYWLWLGETVVRSKFFKSLDASLEKKILQITEQQQQAQKLLDYQAAGHKTTMVSAEVKARIRHNIWRLSEEGEFNLRELARAGKVLRRVSYDCDDGEENKEWLVRALMLCERSLETAETGIALWNCGKAHLQLWALQVCENRRFKRAAAEEHKEMHNFYPSRCNGVGELFVMTSETICNEGRSIRF